MSRLQWALLLLVVAEAVGGAVLLVRQSRQAVPPEADLSEMDPLAAEELRELRRRCKTPEDLARLGEAYLAFGRAQEAEACLTLASERRPKNAKFAFELAFVQERMARLEQAKRNYHRADSLWYEHWPECYYFFDRNLQREEDEGGEGFARAAGPAGGQLPAAKYERARLHVRRYNPDDAIPILDELSQQHPKAIQPYLLRYRVALWHDSPKAAIYADKAARARGRLPTPFDRQWTRLESRCEGMGLERQWREAKSELAAGNHRDAHARLKSVLERRWEPKGVDLLAEAEILAGRPEEAVRLLQEVIDRAGPSAHFLIRLGDAHAEAGQMDLAAKAWTRAVDLGIGAEVKDTHYKLATYHEKAGRKAEAKRSMAQAYLAAGHESFWNENLAEAREALTKATELAPRSAAAWFYLGETHRLIGREAPARRAYQTCLEYDPDHGRAHTGLTLLELRE